MAQTGFTPIQLYYSSTTTNVPLAANLANGELAINITDGKLFYKDNANAVQVIGWKTTPTSAGGTGLTSYTAGDTVYYASGTALSKLAIGANTTVMTSSGSAPQWTAQSALSVGTASNLLSNATTGVMQITGPGAGTTRVMTIPNANFTVARLDGAQTFTAAQTIEGTTQIFTVGSSTKKLYFYPDSSGEAITTQTVQNGAGIYFNDTLDSVHLLTGGAYRLSANTAGNVIVETGNLLVNFTSGSNHYIAKAVAEGSDILGVISTTTNLQTAYFMGVSSAGENAAASAIGVRKNSSTSRSINAAGTINASGADYAEYMTKAGDFTIAKGDVVGVDAQGKLTNVFADAISFVVKSTDPSYVGGDVWGNEEALGLTKPQVPNKREATEELEAETDEEFAVRQTQYEANKAVFDAALEMARQQVDRIAFAGQVPVNVFGAIAGQYIIPVNDNGAIKGEAVSNPTFEQYQIAVGKVIALEPDGRAKIIVKVA